MYRGLVKLIPSHSHPRLEDEGPCCQYREKISSPVIMVAKMSPIAIQIQMLRLISLFSFSIRFAPFLRDRIPQCSCSFTSFQEGLALFLKLLKSGQKSAKDFRRLLTHRYIEQQPASRHSAPVPCSHTVPKEPPEGTAVRPHASTST
jgi:hypothetical protein